MERVVAHNGGDVACILETQDAVEMLITRREDK